MKRNERSTYFGIKNLCDFGGNPYNDYLINYKKNNKKTMTLSERIELMKI